MINRFTIRWSTVAMTCAASVLTISNAVAQPAVDKAVPAPAAPAAPDPEAVAKVVKAIDDAIAALPATATTQDVEAAIAFAIDQQAQPPAVALAALDQVNQKTKQKKVRAALANVRSSRIRLAGMGGTGALAGGNGVDLAAGPTVGGGGGTDYSTP